MISIENIDMTLLNQISSWIAARKYGIESSLIITPELKALASDIFKDKENVFFESRNMNSFYELDNILSNYISIITTNYFKKRIISDEIELLKSSYRVTPGFLNKQNLKLEEIDTVTSNYFNAPRYISAKEFLNYYNMPIDDIVGSVQDSKDIERIDNENMKNSALLFLTNKIEYQLKTKILLAIVAVPNARDGIYYLSSVFLFDFDDFADMKSSPVRLFLKLLDYYGINITIHGKTQKFWHYEVLGNLKGRFNHSELHYDLKSKPRMASLLGHTKFADKIGFVYGINFLKYFQDLKNGRI